MLPFVSLPNSQTYVLRVQICHTLVTLRVTPPAPSSPPTLLDEMEDRRQRDKEKQVSPIYPWDHMRRAARETEEQPHKLLSLYETPTRRNSL